MIQPLRISRTRPETSGRVCLSREGGFSLIEALVATAIAVLSVLGLAYTFGVGRATVNRYELARAALGVGQDRLEMCTALPENSDSLRVGWASPEFPFVYETINAGSYYWRVTGFDHPNIPGSPDLKRITVTVRFRNGSGTDSLRLSRLISIPA